MHSEFLLYVWVSVCVGVFALLASYWLGFGLACLLAWLASLLC